MQLVRSGDFEERHEANCTTSDAIPQRQSPLQRLPIPVQSMFLRCFLLDGVITIARNVFQHQQLSDTTHKRRRTTTKRCCVPTRAQSRRRRSMGHGRTGRPPRQWGARLPPPMRAWLTQPHGRRHKAPPQPCALTTSKKEAAVASRSILAFDAVLDLCRTCFRAT